ncbi:type II secretion system secretin GspD [Paraliomyxa miuraensis]|uniref:type II secretion system secretin GspD n=1 Tax=Paraliomyxa miuraensis TaxID=376150 RepID=UPI00224E8E5A|nr:type II secretion system secretin GspD [Paraliomyxa miuraensis]MCX4246927.1 type II secretion system secretin GspD [Paraliomyxa miuraensis]
MSEDPSPSAELPAIGPHDSCREQPLTSRFRITLEREARLTDLVRWMSSVTCRKFIWGTGIRDGKVTVIAPEAVTMQQAHAAFHAALETMGLTVEQTGDYYKVVESKDATRRVLPVYEPGQDAPVHDRFVTQLYRPRHDGRVDEVLAVVEHLKGERGTVAAVGDLVIITDTGSSVARLMKVIEEVDLPDPTEADAIFLHPLRHAEPEELVRIVQETFGRAQAAAAPNKGTRGSAASTGPGDAAEPRITAITADERTRTLVITAPRDGFPVVRRLIERLDVEVPDDGGTLFVLPLRHADPEDVAAVLASLPTSSRGQAHSGGSAAASGQPPRSSPSMSGVSIGGEIHVTADPATRSLVIMASHRDFLSLRRVVEALDRERRQVYIEAYILELSAKHGVGTDVSAHYGGSTDGGGLGFVSSSPGDLRSTVLDTSVLTGLAAGVLGPGIIGSGEFLGTGVDLPAFGVMIQALEQHEDVNIVSDPHMYTADNKTARMEIGKKIPVPTGTNTFSGTGTLGSQTQTTYSREDVALKLEITPHVGEGGALSLDIHIENQEVIEGEQSAGGPTTTKRLLELEEVVARDGQPVVLGGLVQEKETITTRQLPGLGSIPVLGWLFKQRKRSRDKVNLLVVLVPHVLESPDDARRIHERRLAERREFLERQTAFERRDLDVHVDYRHKAGLLATVEAEGRRMNEEAAFHLDAQSELGRDVAERIAPDGSVELTAGP